MSRTYWFSGPAHHVAREIRDVEAKGWEPALIAPYERAGVHGVFVTFKPGDEAVHESMLDGV